jgi:hypothetical protein
MIAQPARATSERARRSSTMKPSVAVLAALGTVLALPSGAGAAVAQPYNPRPHSDFSLRDRQVRLARFASVRIVAVIASSSRSR